MNSFIYNGKEIEYYVDRGKRKNYYLTIRNGEVVFKVPRGTPDKKIEELIFPKRKWIYDHLIKKPVYINKKPKYEDGELMYLSGIGYEIQINKVENKSSTIKLFNNKFIVTIPNNISEENRRDIIKKLFDKFYFNYAEIKVKQIMDELIVLTGMKPIEFRIRNLKTAWGNCSVKKRICINKDIVKFSDNAIKYVCIHELCHLKYMNHSKDFWNLVKKYMPDYKIYEEELKH